MNIQIIPQRVPLALVDDKPIYISREWYLFLYNLFTNATSSDAEEEGSNAAEFSSAENAKRIASLEMFTAWPNVNPSELGKINQRITNLELLEGWPHARQSDVGQINQRLAALELDDAWPYARQSDVKQVNQRVSDLEVTVAMAVGGVSSGSTFELTAAEVEAVGYWSPLTNGDPVTPELIFDSFGDTVSVFTATP